jgi:hypothetical protein
MSAGFILKIKLMGLLLRRQWVDGWFPCQASGWNNFRWLREGFGDGTQPPIDFGSRHDSVLSWSILPVHFMILRLCVLYVFVWAHVIISFFCKSFMFLKQTLCSLVESIFQMCHFDNFGALASRPSVSQVECRDPWTETGSRNSQMGTATHQLKLMYTLIILI